MSFPSLPKRKREMNRKIIIKDFFSKGENLYEDQLGWTKREKLEARSLVSKEIFFFEIVTVGLNLAFYYVEDDKFYGIHTENVPIIVKELPRDNPGSPYINSQCKGDTHVDGKVLFSFNKAEDLWDGIIINGKSLEEVLRRSFILTLD
jgi:hypothetical protein